MMRRERHSRSAAEKGPGMSQKAQVGLVRRLAGRARSKLRRRLPAPQSVERKLRGMRSLWDRLCRRDEYSYISHVQPGAEWNRDEFALVGRRFVERMIERFEEFGSLPLAESRVLEIGCGVGRFLRPLSESFRSVIGMDISSEMLKAAQRYCQGLGNVSLRPTDGKSLRGVRSRSVDYCVSAGVFQHITHFDCIAGYVREALRVLRANGVFLFQFVGTRRDDIGHGSFGARITAGKLNGTLRRRRFEICELSCDPEDPVRNMIVVLRKRPWLSRNDPARTDFTTFPMTQRPWRGGVYDGIETATMAKKRLAEEAQRITFYD